MSVRLLESGRLPIGHEPAPRMGKTATMSRKHSLIFLVFFLFSLCALAQQNQNYPFSIETQNDGSGYRIVAKNDGPAPISVKVMIPEWRSVTTDRQFPVFAVVPPHGGVLHLGHVLPAIRGTGFSFTTQSRWLLGDFNAVQSRDALYRLPFRDGLAFRIGQAPGGPITTHTSPEDIYAVDIPMPKGTPVVAARDGVVIYTEANQVYGAKSPDMLTKANEVRIQHVDGTIATYAHLEHGGVYVYPGQKVTENTPIGLAGSTGYSSGPHLHFVVQAVKRTDSDEGLTVVSLPFRFYVGNPPFPFAPAFGMLTVAEYGSRMTTSESQQVAKSSLVTQSGPDTASRNASKLKAGFDIAAPVRSMLLGVPLWGWVAGLGIAIMIGALAWAGRAERPQNRFDFREPVFAHTPPSIPDEAHSEAKERLIQACGGDTRRAEKLVALEHERSSNINLSDEEAVLRALYSFRQDD